MPALIMSLRGKNTEQMRADGHKQKHSRNRTHKIQKHAKTTNETKKSVRFDLSGDARPPTEMMMTPVRRSPEDESTEQKSKMRPPYEESGALPTQSRRLGATHSSMEPEVMTVAPPPSLMYPPSAPQPVLSSSVPTASVPTASSSEDAVATTGSPTSMGTGKKVMWGVLIGAGVLVVLFLVASFRDRLMKKQRLREMEDLAADLEEEDSANLEQAQMEEYLNRGAMLRKRYQELGQRRSQILQMMGQNKSEAERNSEQFKTMFAQHKTSFDDDIADQEDEQRLDTAFMLKTDLDEKKNGMIKRGEMLGKQMQAMRAEIQKVDAELKQLTDYYNSTYVEAAIPLGASGVPAIHETSGDDLPPGVYSEASQGSAAGAGRGVSWRPTSEVRLYDPQDPPRSVGLGSDQGRVEQQQGARQGDGDGGWADLDRAGAKLGQYPDGVPPAPRGPSQEQVLQAQLARADAQRAQNPVLSNTDSMAGATDATSRAIAKAMSDYGRGGHFGAQGRTKSADFPEEFPRDGTGRALIPS